MVSPFVLTVLKYVFLALLYFFVYRAIRAVAVDIRAADRRASQDTKVTRSRGKARGKAPASVIVRAEDGKKLSSHPLRETLQLGRAEACHIRLDDRYASQFHARLFERNGGWFLEDLGSTNGTYLNRQRVSGTVEVHAGDEIRIGRTTMELKK